MIATMGKVTVFFVLRMFFEEFLMSGQKNSLSLHVKSMWIDLGSLQPR